MRPRRQYANRLGIELTRQSIAMVLFLVIAAPAWAEYCQSQCSPRIPKSQIGPYDVAVFLGTAEIIASEQRHLPCDVIDADRVNAFRTDLRLPIDKNPACDDYKGSGFDRGHMVPRSDMNRSLVAIVNTFFLTNMTPQYPNVNQGVWARLEDWARAWAKVSGWVHIISGSVFDDNDDETPHQRPRPRRPRRAPTGSRA